MDETITVETDLFNHREVKPHFINPCCFGEDFAAWLKEQLSPLADYRFSLSKIIQEDHGWGFWARHGKNPFWLALAYLGDRPGELPARWNISISYDPGLNLIKRLFHKPDSQAWQILRDHVVQVVTSNPAIRMVPSP